MKNERKPNNEVLWAFETSCNYASSTIARGIATRTKLSLKGFFARSNVPNVEISHSKQNMELSNTFISCDGVPRDRICAKRMLGLGTGDVTLPQPKIENKHIQS